MNFLPISDPRSRRGFLGVAAGAALAAAGPSLRAGESLEPIDVAVIGSGGRGCDLIRSLSTITSVNLAGICDNYPPHLERGLKYAGPQAVGFADYRKMIDDVQPRAVVIAVPLVSHYQLASEALDAGCDVFCEKTMCYALDEALRLAEQVESGGRVFQVGLQRRANPIYQQAAAMVQAGVLGQITAIKSQWHRNNNWRRPVPVPKSDPAWLPLERKLNWRLYRESSGGLMAELGSHQMDVANWILGVTPRRVLASGGIDYWRDGRDVNDNVFCIYEYELPRSVSRAGNAADRPSGSSEAYIVRVTYSSLCNNAYEGASELVMGTRGTLYLTSNKGLLFRERTGDEVAWGRRIGADADADAAVITSGKTLKLSNSPWAHRGEPIELDNLDGDDTRDELVSFVKHVRERNTKTLCDVREGLRDTCTVLMANQAADRGCAVDYPA
ncbi:MAG TPA: Gfo/Idh/MocA family oxidoreductase [Pirellulales bacterium]|nr:Gfo/Idh/MocA family oxidoreductase [Pirellulales bacterium]